MDAVLWDKAGGSRVKMADLLTACMLLLAPLAHQGMRTSNKQVQVSACDLRNRWGFNKARDKINADPGSGHSLMEACWRGAHIQSNLRAVQRQRCAPLAGSLALLAVDNCFLEGKGRDSTKRSQFQPLCLRPLLLLLNRCAD
eukprot:1162078-Pelagomonas_calceolata.AAC.3